MAKSDKVGWWKDLFRKDVVAGHVISTLVGLAVSFILGLLVTLFWVTYSAWRGAYMWTQRLVGASMAFAVSATLTAVALAILSRRLSTPNANRPVSKGYLDHKADNLESLAEIAKRLNKITAITVEETERTKANIVQIGRIYKLPDNARRLSREIAHERREARSTDKTTRRLAKEVALLERAIETHVTADLAYWKWHTQNHQLGASAQELIGALEGQLRSIEENLRVRTEARITTVGRMGRSQVLNEAVERRLVVIDRQSAAISSQKAPLQEVIALLKSAAPPS